MIEDGLEFERALYEIVVESNSKLFVSIFRQPLGLKLKFIAAMLLSIPFPKIGDIMHEIFMKSFRGEIKGVFNEH